MAKTITPIPTGARSIGSGSMSAADRLDDEEDRRRGDEDRLAKPRQRLRLAVAEAVLAVRRLERVAHGKQVDERGENVHHRIGERREQAHGIGHEPGTELGGDHQRCGSDREGGRTAHQPPRAFRLDLGSGRDFGFHAGSL